jgi:hypothetical protein
MTRLARAAVLALAALPVLVLAGSVLFPQAALYRTTLAQPALDHLGTIAKLLLLAIAAAAGASVVARFERGNPARPGWALLAGGLFAFLLAQAVYTFYQLVRGQPSPFPSLADVFFLLGYPLLIAALFAFLRSYRASGFPVGGPGERAAIALVAAVVLAAPLVPLVRAPAPWLHKLLDVAYPLLDAVLMIPAILLLRIAFRFRGGLVWRVWLALLGGFACNWVGDTAFAYFSQLGRPHLAPLVDIGYLLAFAGLALGVLYQRDLLAD